MFLRLDEILWAEIILFWYFVEMLSYFKRFQLCILNIFHQNFFLSKLLNWTYFGAGTMVSARMTLMHQSIPSTNIPPGATPGVLHSTAAPGPGFILDDLPRGPEFCISIKLRLVQ